ncbi:PREDICTED: DNA-directed primase/polymerase protein-like [Dufourea novaeangliae]|uniref:DNA-directed primase/polymerase protein-like n=1 Tax=Dufourea novaeangliae TaxID=178035 RepID=UPI000766F534|nr:PREDICTED: DNA-directed primase/polymerase protein-like [Dufourea novaeangliae]XP_015432454.1 PREDICTED: DNA-directed primase/polymerase protein-like [Dufourea novaeangliae]
MSSAMSVISPKKFYDNQIITKVAIQTEKLDRKPSWVKEHRSMPSHILGPTIFWKEFDRQADALATAFKESSKYEMLCTFVYQRDNGYRRFVVAHPEVYWWHYEHRPPEKRCSYEVIPENSPCRLYLDLEYLVELNRAHDGPAMTSLIIGIFEAYLLRHWGLPCNIYNVVNLDSSTPEKFSRHIIFHIKDVAFKDNNHVGRLIKSVCIDISDYVSSNEKHHDILSSFERTKLEQLFVQTTKGKRLFIDTTVYTRNRHFRIYKSTKWGKQSNLVISDDCKYIPSNLYKDKELNIFLDSLISYFVATPDLILLEYSKHGTADANRFKEQKRWYICQRQNNCYSRFPMLDKYIHDKIHPGKIRLCKYSDSAEVLVYETYGYRFCENIGRCHKSNNVFLVVDLQNKTLYQKCHDEDCYGFQSDPKKLPEEISFEIDDEGDMLLNCVILTEDI